jgi:hypothetical protein
MPIQDQSWSFVESLVKIDRNQLGVYELAKGAQMTSGEDWRSIFRQNATHYRIEYTADYENRARELYQVHIATYGKAPEVQ